MARLRGTIGRLHLTLGANRRALLNLRWRRQGVAAVGAAALLWLAGFVYSPSASGAEYSKGTTTLHSCTWSALQAAIAKGGTVVFACSGTIAPTTAITVSGSESLVLDAAGENVVLMGHEVKYTGTTNTIRLFVVNGGSLVLDHLTLEDSQVEPPPGQNGTKGTAGTTGQVGSGDDGTSGGPGTSGAIGTVAQGGAVYVASKGHVSILFSTFEDDGVAGSRGGNGGAGGNGGSGALNDTSGVQGGNGGNGGNAGAGGGANGQPGEGGAIFNAGTLAVVDDTFTMNAAYGGGGGTGGSGGAAGTGGAGSTGAYNTCQTGGNGGDAGALAGQAGDGGNAGAGEGGAVYNTGTLHIAGGSFSENGALGGAGGNGGNGASGFSGGSNPCGTGGGATGGTGSSGTNGDNGRPGGNGGAGLGGAVYNAGSLQISGVTVSTNLSSGAAGGTGGSGGAGGTGGHGGTSYANACTDPDAGCLEQGGNGGNGGGAGDGGNAGLAAGGAVYSTSTLASSSVRYSSNLLKGHAGASAGQSGQLGKGGAEGGINGEAGASASSGKSPTPEGQNEVGSTRGGPSLTTTSLPGAVVGKAYSVTLKVAGGTAPYSWALVSGSLPKGLTLSASKGTISGKPAAKATSALVVTVTDHSGEIAVASLKLSVAAAGTAAGCGTFATAPGKASATTPGECVPGSIRSFCSPLAISSDGTHVWVASEAPLKGGPGSGAVTELDATSGTVAKRIFGPSYGFNRPYAISSDGKHVWVADANGNSVTELSASTGKLVRVISGSAYKFDAPAGIASDGTHVWVANYSGHSVTELSASTGKLVKVIEGSAYDFADPLGVASDKKHVWVTNYGGKTVTELNVSTGTLVHVLSGPTYDFDEPWAVSSDGTHVWVANHAGDSVTELNASTGALVQVLSASKFDFVKLRSISSDGKHVWVVSDGGYNAGDSVTELNASTGALVQVIHDASGEDLDDPDAVCSDGTHVWVGDYGGNGVIEFSASTGKKIKVIG